MNFFDRFNRDIDVGISPPAALAVAAGCVIALIAALALGWAEFN